MAACCAAVARAGSYQVQETHWKRMPYSSPQSGFLGMHFPALQAKKKPAVQHMSANPMTCAQQTNQDSTCISVLLPSILLCCPTLVH